jgi:hypothetical protein
MPPSPIVVKSAVVDLSDWRNYDEIPGGQRRPVQSFNRQRWSARHIRLAHFRFLVCWFTATVMQYTFVTVLMLAVEGSRERA